MTVDIEKLLRLLPDRPLRYHEFVEILEALEDDNPGDVSAVTFIIGDAYDVLWYSRSHGHWLSKREP